MQVWVYSLPPPPPRFRLFTVFFHVPDLSKAQTSHKTCRCVVLQQAGKREIAAGMLDSAFHLISKYRIHKKQKSPLLWRDTAEDLGAASRHENCIVVTLVLHLFTNFLHYLSFLGVSLWLLLNWDSLWQLLPLAAAKPLTGLHECPPTATAIKDLLQLRMRLSSWIQTSSLRGHECGRVNDILYWVWVIRCAEESTRAEFLPYLIISPVTHSHQHHLHKFSTFIPDREDTAGPGKRLCQFPCLYKLEDSGLVTPWTRYKALPMTSSTSGEATWDFTACQDNAQTSHCTQTLFPSARLTWVLALSKLQSSPLTEAETHGWKYLSSEKGFRWLL